MPYDSAKVAPDKTGKVNLLNDQGMTINAVIERGSGNNSTTAYTESVYTENGEPIKVNGSEFNPLKASRMVLVEDGYLMKNESIKGAENGNYTLLIMGTNGDYTPILIDKHLENSMFTRLYLLGGAGQDVFEPVHAENGVMLYKVNFNSTSG